mgnify:CR=1 FL=1
MSAATYLKPVIGVVNVVRDVPTAGWRLSHPWQHDGAWCFSLSLELEREAIKIIGHFFLEPGRIRFWLPWHEEPNDSYTLECARRGTHLEGSHELFDQLLDNLAFTAHKTWRASLAPLSDPHLLIGPYRTGKLWRTVPRDESASPFQPAPCAPLSALSDEGFDGSASDRRVVLTLMRALADRPGKSRAADLLHFVFGGTMARARELATEVIELHPELFDRNAPASAYRLSPNGYRVMQSLEDEIGGRVPVSTSLCPQRKGGKL